MRCVRRTEAGAAGHPGADAVERAAAIMARAHGWDEWRTRNEIGEVEAFFSSRRLTARRRRMTRAEASDFFRGRIHAFFIGKKV